MDLVHRAALRACRSKVFGRRLHRIALTVTNLHTGWTFDQLENGEAALIACVLGELKETARPAVFVDIGAHVGDWTSLVLHYAQGRPMETHVFEPTPESFVRLSDRYSGITGISLYPAALADFSGEAWLLLRGGGGVGNSLASDSDVLAGTVHSGTRTKVLTGDEFLHSTGLDRVDLMKIDTEGWDLEVLRGFVRALEQNRVSVLQFEYTVVNSRTRRLMADFYEYLSAFGYRIGPLRPDGVQFRPFELSLNDFKSGPNFVAALPAWVGALEQF